MPEAAPGEVIALWGSSGCSGNKAVKLGAILAIAAKLHSEEREQAIALWRRRGKRAFQNNSPFGTGYGVATVSGADL